ncbi:hypothetical protein EIN_408880 [Entamoeba invadens IP1]|uniref:Defective in cullin neddylation protein n=1 Tax=Entamoeba invadens IP1 TaxID=370355 RepID=A0A0A1TWL7_ENTIV|nr:hypothetical protein EIN_408880 [Entamoeba invadens IP1]ELP85609.1 hypothetical protein EIN_408880 [Entamoeba invadens IP1]|eukprot:XP_004184955.1 hypothetical protein EIN_408880 [Entamoeba invadens IP1]
MIKKNDQKKQTRMGNHSSKHNKPKIPQAKSPEPEPKKQGPLVPQFKEPENQGQDPRKWTPETKTPQTPPPVVKADPPKRVDATPPQIQQKPPPTTQKEKEKEKKVDPPKETHTQNTVEADFNKFLEEGKDHISVGTITSFFAEIGIDEENIGGLQALWVMWKLGSVEMGVITLQKYINGMSDLHVQSLQQLKEVIPKKLPQDLRSKPIELKKFLSFAFTYNLEKSKQLDKETTSELLALFYPDKPKQITNFMKFLNQPKSQMLRKDEWLMLYDFFNNIKEDLSNYQMDTTWPIMFDDYVEWKKAQKE